MAELSEGSVVDGRYRVLQPDRLGRDGRRLARRGPAPAAPGGAQGPAQPLRPGPRIRRALPPRGRVGGRPQPPERRLGLRPRRSRRHLLHRDAVPRRPLAEGADRRRADPRAVGLPDPPGARGRALRAPQRHRPPRPEAAERDRRRRRQGGRHRLRHRPRRGLGDHPDRLGDGDAALPLARSRPRAKK